MGVRQPKYLRNRDEAEGSNQWINFILTAIDGDIAGGVDKFQIKIWKKATSAIVFDNQMGASDTVDFTTPVGNCSGIVIRK